MLWGSPQACVAYFDHLVLDDGGNRPGFPNGVALELMRLKNHFVSEVSPSIRTVGDEASTRLRA